jgi:hypothetical protein
MGIGDGWDDPFRLEHEQENRIERMFRESQGHHQLLAREHAERIAREQAVADASSYASNSATHTVGSLIQAIAEFEALLTAQQELALFVVGGPSGMQFFPTELIALDPNKVKFCGVNSEGRPFAVIQHISQLNVAMPCVQIEPTETPRRIGFHLPEDDEA